MVNVLSALTAIATVLIKLVIIIVAGLIISNVVAGIIRKSKKLDMTAKSFFANFASMAI